MPAVDWKRVPQSRLLPGGYLSIDVVTPDWDTLSRGVKVQWYLLLLSLNCKQLTDGRDGEVFVQ